MCPFLQALAGLFQRIRTARATVKRFSKGSQFANPRKQAKAVRDLANVERKLEGINRQYGRQWTPDVVGAFVVFNCEEVGSRRFSLPYQDTNYVTVFSFFSHARDA